MSKSRRFANGPRRFQSVAAQKQDYVDTHQPTDLAPDTTPGTQKATIRMATGLTRNDPITGQIVSAGGQYNPKDNTITTLPNQRNVPILVGHEMGHAMWQNDLSFMDKAKWSMLHMNHIAGGNQSLPSRLTAYSSDPSHSFAESYGWYMDNPAQMKSAQPDLYNFIRDRIGFEYTGAGDNPAAASGMAPNIPNAKFSR